MPDSITQLDDFRAIEGTFGQADPKMSANVLSMTRPADSPSDPESESANQLAELVQAVTIQDRDAFESLYDATVQRIYSLALRVTCRRELAEEVVSDVYMQVWQQAGNYSRDRGKVIAWLSMLCRSRALDALRRDNTGVQRAAVGLEAITEPEDIHGPPDFLQSVEQGSALHDALSLLSEHQRQLLALAYFRGYTHRELATSMDIPIGTVKTHLHRAIIKLKDLMSIDAGMYGKPNG